jgi:hypothetical protein
MIPWCHRIILYRACRATSEPNKNYDRACSQESDFRFSRIFYCKLVFLVSSQTLTRSVLAGFHRFAAQTLVSLPGSALGALHRTSPISYSTNVMVSNCQDGVLLISLKNDCLGNKVRSSYKRLPLIVCRGQKELRTSYDVSLMNETRKRTIPRGRREG